MRSATNSAKALPPRPQSPDSTAGRRRGPLLLLAGALLLWGQLVEVAPAAPDSRFQPGDRVKFEFMGGQHEGEVTRFTGTGWPYVKFTWRGKEMERFFPPNRLQAVQKKPAATTRPRTWTDTSGKFRIRATLVERIGENVRLKKSDGKEISVPLARLSETDRKWLQQWAPDKTAPEDAQQPEESPFADGRPGPGQAAPPGDGVERLPVAAAAAARPIVLTPKAGWDYRPATPVPPASFEARPIALRASGSQHAFHDRASVLVGTDGAMAAIGLSNPFDKRTIVRLVDLRKGQQLAACTLGSEHFAPFDCGSGGLVLTANDVFGKPNHLAIYKPSGDALELTAGWKMADSVRSRGIASAFFVGQDRLLSTDRSGNATLWDRDARRAVASFKTGGAVAPAFDTARRRMAVVAEQAIHLIDLEKLRHVASIPLAEAPVAGLAFSPDGRKLAAYDDGLVRTWNLDNGRLLGEIWLLDEPAGTTIAWAGESFLLVGSSHLVDVRLGLSVWKLEKDHAVKSLVPGGSTTFWYLFHDQTQSRLLPIVLPPSSVAEACARYQPADLDWLEPGPISLDLAGLPFSPSEQQQIRASLASRLEGHGYKVQAGAPLVVSAKVERAKTKTIGVREWFKSRFGQPDATITYTPTRCHVKIVRGDQVLWQRSRSNDVPSTIHLKKNETPQQAADRCCRPKPEFFSQARLPKRGALLPGGKTSLGSSRLTVDGAR